MIQSLLKANKREARRWTDLAEQLCGLGGRNLAAVLSLADEALSDAVQVAQRIPRRNQGRRRQVNLVGKLLRELPDAESGRLEAAVQSAVLGRGPSDSHSAERLASNWYRGLIANDQAAVSEVFELPLEWGADHQELRQLTRGAQQELAEEEARALGGKDSGGAKAKAGAKGTKLRRVWFARVLRDGVSLSITQHFAPFKEVGEYHLRALLTEAGVADDIDTKAAEVLGAFDEVEPFDDVRPGLARCREAGIQVATMTNGSVSISEGCLRRASLEGLVVKAMDVTAVQRWKPAGAVYAHVARELGLAPYQVMLAAVHPFDTHGAKAAGLQAAFIDRSGRQEYPPFYLSPDITVPSIPTLVDHLEAFRPHT
ncbi:hypothetical protein WJX81_004672 [Elliptochloris bilobata]|uniref:Uncharacterized protein n=1 Tax=Elliptochloris bilobata TaxID=381761 RepID=A0AAW1REB1_9CHLO